MIIVCTMLLMNCSCNVSSRPGDPIDSIRTECIIRNHPADNNTLELAELALAGVALSLSFIVIDNSSITSG